MGFIFLPRLRKLPDEWEHHQTCPEYTPISVPKEPPSTWRGVILNCLALTSSECTAVWWMCGVDMYTRWRTATHPSTPTFLVTTCDCGLWEHHQTCPDYTPISAPKDLCNPRVGEQCSTAQLSPAPSRAKLQRRRERTITLGHLLSATGNSVPLPW